MYPYYIMRDVRQNLGLEPNDTSMDDEIISMDPEDVLRCYWEWNGIIGYTHQIISSVCDVLGFDY